MVKKAPGPANRLETKVQSVLQLDHLRPVSFFSGSISPLEQPGLHQVLPGSFLLSRDSSIPCTPSSSWVLRVIKARLGLLGGSGPNLFLRPF